MEVLVSFRIVLLCGILPTTNYKLFATEPYVTSSCAPNFADCFVVERGILYR